MIGAIVGDIIGSIYEGAAAPPSGFPLFHPRSRFTDDTVLTVAVASAIRLRTDYGATIRRWGRQYPSAGYGGYFRTWLADDDAGPYNSYGNGSAMRASAVGWAFDDLAVVLDEAARSAAPTHNHPEGIRGAQAVAGAIFLARTGEPKAAMCAFLTDRMGYDCSQMLESLQQQGRFDVTCEGTVPQAAVAFLASTDFESAVRNAVSLGGDADTLACIAGAIAEPYYGCVPEAIQAEAFRRLDSALRAEAIAFAERFRVPVHESVR